MSIFKRKKSTKSEVKFADIDGLPLEAGDRVLSLRYDLGECIIINTEEGLAYESVEKKTVVSWVKMVEAASKNQKVRKL
ncbi:MAG: hypothetical protein K9H49_18730 [Bacteroidales bacterium]|nr:hypothetical protein [Bacteroidales bacterium]MCF8391653.1 hypothetical protein [Bacteroidales bacterium]